jgi:hypothetical protein
VAAFPLQRSKWNQKRLVELIFVNHAVQWGNIHRWSSVIRARSTIFSRDKTKNQDLESDKGQRLQRRATGAACQ